jgi:hypothetical protein
MKSWKKRASLANFCASAKFRPNTPLRCRQSGDRFVDCGFETSDFAGDTEWQYRTYRVDGFPQSGNYAAYLGPIGSDAKYWVYWSERARLRFPAGSVIQASHESFVGFPEPGSLILMGSGILGLAALVRRKLNI